MQILNYIIIITILTTALVASVLASPADIFTRKIKPAQNQLVFPNNKGEVIFSHSIHINSLKEDHCILCHKIDNPSLESIQSRFENHRVAHSFCKGCHAKLGSGPTECHQCHNYKKTT